MIKELQRRYWQNQLLVSMILKMDSMQSGENKTLVLTSSKTKFNGRLCLLIFMILMLHQKTKSKNNQKPVLIKFTDYLMNQGLQKNLNRDLIMLLVLVRFTQKITLTDLVYLFVQ